MSPVILFGVVNGAARFILVLLGICCCIEVFAEQIKNLPPSFLGKREIFIYSVFSACSACLSVS